jgi:transcriptional regulator NrdR family protein
MKCPECRRPTKVKEVRPTPNNGQRRRYDCLCGYKWSTRETIEVLERGGAAERYYKEMANV